MTDINENSQSVNQPSTIDPQPSSRAVRLSTSVSLSLKTHQSLNDLRTSVSKDSPSKPQAEGPSARWYVVHTYAGQESKVANNLKQRIASQGLQDKILDIFIPTAKKIEVREGKKYEVTEKVFPGYILVKMILDDRTWLTVRSTTGVTGFVGIKNQPTPISDQEVAAIQKFAEMEAPKFKTKFSVGEAVKIIDGPFAEFLGTVAEIDDEKGKVKILVSIFGRETPVELDFLQVAKL